jgi:hypothetical protein
MRIPAPRLVVTLVAGLAIFLVPVATATAASTQMSVTALPNKTLVPTDTTFHISGLVASTTTPLVARLQQLVKTTWNYVGVARTSSAGAYVMYFKQNQVGTDTFRVAIFATASMPVPKAAPLAISPQFKVTVAAWTYLAKLKFVESDAPNGVATGQAEIDGVTYDDSLIFKTARGAEYVAYNLERHCYSLSAVLGLDDNSNSGAYGEFTVTTDGKTVFDNRVSLGQARDMSLNVSGVFRLVLNVNFTGPKGAGRSGYDLVYGDARAFCSF